MDVASLRSPLMRRIVETINSGRLDDFMALFAHDATLVDGPTYHGDAAIRGWAQGETFGVHMHVDVVREKTPAGTTVDVKVRSTGGYSGPGTFSVTARGDLIGRLVIG